MSGNKEIMHDSVETVAPKSNKDAEMTSPTTKEMIVDDLDFNELFILEQELMQLENNLNKLAGTILRLSKDQETILMAEKNKKLQIEQRKQDLIRRHGIDQARRWRIDRGSKRVIYID